ncbi:MAG: esterase/lipase superfamily enzyme [Verrucomicrobiales bacterium]
MIEEDSDERRYRFTHAIIRKAASALLSVLHLEDLHAAAAASDRTGAKVAASGARVVTIDLRGHNNGFEDGFGVDVDIDESFDWLVHNLTESLERAARP